jgi:hypothetical protein
MTHSKVLFAAVLFVLPICVTATIHYVPGDFNTIQDAINAAVTGDTVLVSPGTYRENVTFRGKALTLGSWMLMTGDTAYVSQTVIDGSQASNPDTASVICIDYQPDTLSQVVGLTLTGGTGTVPYEYPYVNVGGGMAIRDAQVLIRNCHIIENGPVFQGGGLMLIGGHAVVQETRFEANSSTYGAAFTAVYGFIECLACEICNHAANSEVCWVDSASFLVRDCKFHDNSAMSTSAFVTAWSTGRFVANLVYRNVAYDRIGGVIEFTEGTIANVDSNEVWENEGSVGIVGMSCSRSCSLRWNYIHDNIGNEECAGLGTSGSDFQDHYLYIYRNKFIHNVGARGGAVFASALSKLKFVENYFEANEATVPGQPGVIFCVQPSHIWMRGNDIEYNDSLAIGGEILHDMYHLPVDAVENYWGDSTGPYHPILNPTGLGNAVSDCVRFIPWLREPPAEVGKSPAPVPQTFALLAPYPNPFNPGVMLPLEVNRPGQFKVEVFDLLGRLIWSRTEQYSAGTYRIYWPGVDSQGESVATGIYFARASCGNQITSARKLVLLK